MTRSLCGKGLIATSENLDRFPINQKNRPDLSGRFRKKNLKTTRLWEKIHRTCSLDLAGDRAMHLGGNAGHLAGKNTTGLGGELGQDLGVLITDLLKWQIETLGGHRLVVLTEVDPALDGLWLRHDKKWYGIRTIEARDGGCDD